MRKLFAFVLTLTAFTSLFAQTTPKKPLAIGKKAGDHFMVQIGTNIWSGAPDSISSRIKGFNRSANVYLMLDKPFRGNPKLSAAFGLGIGTSNIYFKKMNVKISASSPLLPFVRTDTGNSYKKYKLSTAFLELPIELRFSSNPENPNKSLKAAIGVKVGTLLNAHTKARFLETAAGAKLNSTTIKETNKVYFNTTRLAATARVGYGLFSLYGSYSITGIFKDGVSPDIKLVQVGLTISGL
jgi:hypothetical protein